MDETKPPTPLSQRFTLELEFVLCLSNPQYLQYLAVTHPHLLSKPTASRNLAEEDDSDADRFVRYLKYLYRYWRTPRYVQYLAHPGATLRNLELLQQEQFRKDLIRPDVIAGLFETNEPPSATTNGEDKQKASEQPGTAGDAENSGG
ncbi:Mediator of RNA polymerase II transcription subunit 31 [Cladophialophora chaetospira]|uniref:Mediator of RNA polymerase II transcription subunit 31 n=1 Tax=Cladophialophora chaetospira TaxID=386627 RepID=A0AA39CIE6_9EURO|nr:Mediator of RNA polymerase II transcription subunit 31 [Cladophialophora chaetospira]